MLLAASPKRAPPRLASTVAIVLCCWWQAAVGAECSREIRVPVSAIGGDIVIGPQGQVSGLIPDLLAELSMNSPCRFTFVPVPRVRALAMFGNGEVDLLPGAVHTDERDKVGEFVPFTSARVAAVGLRKRMAALGPLDATLSGSYIVNVVRGYDYGPAYRALVASLRAQHRVEEVVDPLTAARKLGMGRADLILIAPGALVEATEQAGISDTVQAVPVMSIPAFVAGIYVSRLSLGAAERDLLVAQLSDRTLKQKYWRMANSSMRPWALVGAKLVN
jgi:polar amino acid transport system substrate-binding protein